MNKIKICTLYFEGKYTPDYVEKLHNIKKYCSLPFEFICYSDNPNVNDVVIPLKPHSDIKNIGISYLIFHHCLLIKNQMMILLLWI